MTVSEDVFRFIDGFAPFDSAMGFDNPGLLVGSGREEVKKALLSLDITPEVVREAVSLGAGLIVSHHPVIFEPLKAVRPGTAVSLLVQNGIAAVCAHTNLDMAEGGVNDCLARRLGLKNVRPLKEYENSGLPEALQGETEREYAPREFAEFVKRALGCDGLRYTDGGRPVTRVGLCGGGGAGLLYDAAGAGCQAYVTGESKHNILIDAENLGVTFVDAGHFYTENVVILPLCEKLKARFPDVAFTVSERMHAPAQYL